MINRNLSRRLERLEAQWAPSGIQHVITVTYVNADGSQAGSGYRREGPLPGRVAKNIPESGGWPRRMINRNLSRRLERLEETITPETVRRVWQILIVQPDGGRREAETIEWQAPRSVQGGAQSFRKRYR
jgi:hypothetical protein